LRYANRHQGSFIILTVARSIVPTTTGNFLKTTTFSLRCPSKEIVEPAPGLTRDNAAVETFFKSLKAELIWRDQYETREQTQNALFQYINGFYNPRRRHSYLGSISPVKYESLAG